MADALFGLFEFKLDAFAGAGAAGFLLVGEEIEFLFEHLLLGGGEVLLVCVTLRFFVLPLGGYAHAIFLYADFPSCAVGVVKEGEDSVHLEGLGAVVPLDEADFAPVWDFLRSNVEDRRYSREVRCRDHGVRDRCEFGKGDNVARRGVWITEDGDGRGRSDGNSAGKGVTGGWLRLTVTGVQGHRSELPLILTLAVM